MPTTPATTAGTPLKVAAPSLPPLSSSPSLESEFMSSPFSESLSSPAAAPEELLVGWLLEPDDDLSPPADDLSPPADEDEGDPDDFEALLDFDDLESDDFELLSPDFDLPESSSDFELPPPPAAAPPEPSDFEPLSPPPFKQESSPLPTGPA